MKSQISIEFITGVAIMLFIFALTLFSYSGYTEEDITISEQMQQICYTVSSYVDSAVIGRGNFFLNGTLPYKAAGKDYFVVIENDSFVTVNTKTMIFACSINTQNITSVYMDGGDFSMANLNNTIYVSRLVSYKTEYAPGEEITVEGGYFLTNVTLDIRLKQGPSLAGYPKEKTLSEMEFSETFNINQKGTYEIIAYDSKYKDLNAKREILII
ncbi:MAG TPA: hypothetical protein ENN30_02335 [Candidatus Woesearchaeota archaeon]|nr:hypothetical protein [Candidatus Woesearchaeota archaeon]